MNHKIKNWVGTVTIMSMSYITAYAAAAPHSYSRHSPRHVTTNRQVSEHIIEEYNSGYDSGIKHGDFYPGPYLGASAGIHDSSLKARYSWVGNLMLGYEFTPYFATELNYGHYNRGFKTAIGSTRFKRHELDLTGRINAPINQDMSVFGKAGAAWLGFKRFAPTVGLGADFNVAPHLKTEIGYKTILAGHNNNIQAITAGLVFKMD
ncbi:MAG: hypothetical protein Tsb005_11980 [Gammaproteobacteria bacterium]